MIYAALDEAVSFVSLTSPVSLSERLSARVAPCYPATPQQALTQLERVTHAASEVAYAARLAGSGHLRRAGVGHAAS